MSAENKDQLIQKDPRFGHIVCRCETVTEGEILAAIHRPLGARTVDAIGGASDQVQADAKGAFVVPKSSGLLNRELGLEPADINRDLSGSYMVTGTVRSEEVESNA